MTRRRSRCIGVLALPRVAAGRNDRRVPRAAVHRLARGLAGAWRARCGCSTCGSMSGPTSRVTCRRHSTSTSRPCVPARGRPGAAPRRTVVSRTLQRLGLDPAMPVVVYSAGETLNIDATFAVWILASMGHPRVYLLDGGFSKWSFEGREVARQYPRVAADRALVERAMPSGPPWRRWPMCSRACGRASFSSTPARTTSTLAMPAPRCGSATCRARSTTGGRTTSRRSGSGGSFGRRTACRVRYAAEGIVPDRDIILYCNSATEASHLSTSC